MQKKQKSGFGVVGVIIIIAAVVILGGGYWYYFYYYFPHYGERPPESPVVAEGDFTGTRPELVEGWKTYRNEKYGFEFRYAPDLVFQEDLKIDFHKLVPKDARGTPYDFLTIDANKNKDTVFSLSMNHPGFGIEGAEEHVTETVVIDRITATRQWFLSGDSKMVLYGLGERNGNGFMFFARMRRADNDSEKIFDQILSTFKFIK